MSRNGRAALIGGMALLTWTSWAGVLAQESETHSYEGTAVCGMCHKSEKQGAQLGIWEDSLHAQAYEVLKNEHSIQVAKERGIEGNPWEAEDCLRCHATGFDADPSKLGRRFKIEDGVQCETCHGPGSDYKSIKIMRDQAQSVANGLIIYENPEELCVQCHNSESPTFAGFNYDEMWAKIDHPVPE